MRKTRQPVPWIAGVLSFVCPGLGHLYLGKLEVLAIAPILFILSVLTLYLALRGLAGVLVACVVLLGCTVAVALHAVKSARRNGPIVLPWFSRWPLLVLVAIAWRFAGEAARSIGPCRAYRIPSSAMEPTLLPGDFLFADQRLTSKRSIQSGDIVVFKSPHDGRDFIKRCVAVAGDTLELKGKKLYVNGVHRLEPFVQYTDDKVHPPSSDPRDFFGPKVIPPGHVFMMGDNRDNSLDSRYWGMLSVENIKARPLYLYFSWDKSVMRGRFDRIGMKVQ